MDPKLRKEEKLDLVDESSETLMPTDYVEVREQDQDDYYESPATIDGYYNERMRLND